MSVRMTVPCTRKQGEVLADSEDLFPDSENPPVLVADEPDESESDEWLIHAYFEDDPSAEEIAIVTNLGNGPPRFEQLGEEDWVRASQAGLQPIRAGRFFVHTPTYPPEDGLINFEIDAGLAFGTGQHATTAGCLEALDRLACNHFHFTNIADIGAGTGLLAFAAMALWPDARAIATDIDPIAIDVSRDNAAINGIAVGHDAGELLLGVADGMDSPLLSARAPFDLLIANILAGPLIELAPAFAQALAPNGTVILAGLLDTQSDAVTAAYQAQGCTLIESGSGEWRVLVLRGRA